MVVSGNAGPGIDRGPKRYKFTHHQFMNELRKLGGIPVEVLENKELLNLFLPVLRADFQIAEENGLDTEPPVNIPILAIMGEDEEFVERISNWGRYTSAGFDQKILPGGHFFIFKHAVEIANLIRCSFSHAASMCR
jgi:surfactin synthase thioesterase subunit